MNVRELVTEWKFKTDTAPLEKIEKSLEGIKSRLEFLAAAEVIKGVIELTERFAKFAEEIHVAAESAGITVEAFQKLAFAAAKSSVSQEEMSGALARLSRHLYQARQGGAEAQKVFREAGFTGEQIRGFKTGNDVMLALADKFRGIQDPIKKQAIAMQLLGRGSYNMVAFLNQGSAAIGGMGKEAEELGTVLSKDQIDALVKVEHALTTLWAVFKGLGATIASYFAPAIESAIDDFLEFYKANRELIEVNVKQWVWDITYAMGFVYEIVKIATQAFFEFAKSHQTLVRRAGEFIFILGGLATVIAIVQKVVGIFTTAIEVLSGAMTFLTEVFTVFEVPLLPIVAALGLIIVAIHDLWNAAHGKPTWIQAFIDFLGIGQMVQDFMFAIFDIMEDIINLDFGKLFKDLASDLAPIWNVLKAVGGFVGGIGTGVVDFFKDTGPQAVNTVQNLNTAQAVSMSSEPGIPGATQNSSSEQYSMNAPITINVPAGTDHHAVGEKVREGVRDHMDRVHRETARSLTPAVAY